MSVGVVAQTRCVPWWSRSLLGTYRANQLRGSTYQGLGFYDRADALSTMVATQLGGGRWRGARHSARVALCLAAAVMAVAGAVIGAGRNVWPRLFTHDAQVRPVGTAQPCT